MNIKTQINDYISSLPETKRKDILEVHKLMLKLIPKGKLWFLDGKDEKGKVVSNPNIGYGSYTIKYKDGKTREFYQVGLSANTTGISVYVMGIDDRKYLAQAFGKKIGKADASGYCIKFKTLKDIHGDILEEAVRYGLKASAGT
jgi:hypothetical protein